MMGRFDWLFGDGRAEAAYWPRTPVRAPWVQQQRPQDLLDGLMSHEEWLRRQDQRAREAQAMDFV